jgi:hypothetical protein
MTLAKLKLLTWFFLISIVCNNTSAQEASFYKVKTPINTHTKTLSAFFKKIELLLPQKIKADIVKSYTAVVVNFKYMGDIKPCCYPSNKKHSTKYAYFNKQTNSITINTSLITYMHHSKKNLSPLTCYHKNMYAIAQAVVIHETAHLYDHLLAKTTKDCKKDFFSQTKFYLKLFDFSKESNFNKSIKSYSSPDLYELTSSKEHFAVNLEYFILDKTYTYRRPFHSLFFKTLFALDTQITSNHKLILSNSQEILNIDPKTIDNIYYLEASNGGGADSSWGHSMLMLQKIENNEKKHYVLSIAADTDNKPMKYKKVLRGKYLAKFFLYTLKEIITTYHYSQKRSLSAYKLKLSPLQKKLLLYKIIETYWSQIRTYHISSYNCATSIRNILQGVYNNQDFLDSKPLSPKSLRKKLLSYKLIEKTPLLIKNTHKQSLVKLREDIYSCTEKFGIKQKKIPKSKEKRYLFYTEAKKLCPQKQKFSCKVQLYKHFLALEKYLYNIQKAIYYNNIKKLEQSYFSNKLQKSTSKILLQKNQTLEYGVKEHLPHKDSRQETNRQIENYYKLFRKEYAKPLLYLDNCLQESTQVLETIKAEIIEEFLYQKKSLVCKRQCVGGIFT